MYRKQVIQLGFKYTYVLFQLLHYRDSYWAILLLYPTTFLLVHVHTCARIHTHADMTTTSRKIINVPHANIPNKFSHCQFLC